MCVIWNIRHVYTCMREPEYVKCVHFRVVMYHCMIVIVHLKDTSVIELLHIDAIIIKNTHTVVI